MGHMAVNTLDRRSGSNGSRYFRPVALMTGRAGVSAVGSHIMKRFNRRNGTVKICMTVTAARCFADLVIITEHMRSMAGCAINRVPGSNRSHNN